MESLSAGSREIRVIMLALKMPSFLLLAGVRLCPSQGSCIPFNLERNAAQGHGTQCRILWIRSVKVNATGPGTC